MSTIVVIATVRRTAVLVRRVDWVILEVKLWNALTVSGIKYQVSRLGPVKVKVVPKVTDLIILNN